jgi:transcriptional regulator, XRE family
VSDGARAELANRIAGEITLSAEPGATIRKWRTDFDISQTDLAAALDVSASVISDYESGRRESPGIGVVSRIVTGLLAVDADRGGAHIRHHARILSAGFESDIVEDLREYPTAQPIDALVERSTRRSSPPAHTARSAATPSSTPSRRSRGCPPRSSTGCTGSPPHGRSSSRASPAGSRRWWRCGWSPPRRMR